MDVKKKDTMKILTDKYLPAFLAFAHSKIYNHAEAEELAQEIAFQCVQSCSRDIEIDNLNAFLWSIAHNTFKRWCARKKIVSLDAPENSFTSLMDHAALPEEKLLESEETARVRLELSRLSRFYRQTLVCF
jgi:RNA polymerase sigma factor (sigma-70 family)